MSFTKNFHKIVNKPLTTTIKRQDGAMADLKYRNFHLCPFDGVFSLAIDILEAFIIMRKYFIKWVSLHIYPRLNFMILQFYVKDDVYEVRE